MKNELQQLEEKAARLKAVIEHGYGYTNKPMSEKRLKQMRLTLAKVEEDILAYKINNGI